MEEKNKQNKNIEEECPLCQISEETLSKLREKSQDKKIQEKPIKKKKGLWQKLTKR